MLTGFEKPRNMPLWFLETSNCKIVAQTGRFARHEATKSAQTGRNWSRTGWARLVLDRYWPRVTAEWTSISFYFLYMLCERSSARQSWSPIPTKVKFQTKCESWRWIQCCKFIRSEFITSEIIMSEIIMSGTLTEVDWIVTSGQIRSCWSSRSCWLSRSYWCCELAPVFSLWIHLLTRTWFEISLELGIWDFNFFSNLDARDKL